MQKNETASNMLCGVLWCLYCAVLYVWYIVCVVLWCVVCVVCVVVCIILCVLCMYCTVCIAFVCCVSRGVCVSCVCCVCVAWWAAPLRRRSSLFCFLWCLSLFSKSQFSCVLSHRVNRVSQATDDYLFYLSSIDPPFIAVHLPTSVVLYVHSCLSSNLSLQGWHKLQPLWASVCQYHQIYDK